MMDAEHAEISAKRKHEDTDNDLVSVKKIKTEVEESGPQNGEVTEESVGEGKQLSNGLDQSEDESLQGSDADKTLLNNSGELSEDESGSDDENDSDESDEESGEEEEDEHDGLKIMCDDDDDELGEEEEDNGEYHLLEDEDIGLGVEACLGDEDDDLEMTNGMESLFSNNPYSNDANTDLQCKNCFKVFARKSYLRGHSCSKDLQINNKALKCKYCNRRYSHKINLRLHLKLHNNPKQFQCHVCLKYLSSSSSLKVHVKTHSNEKAFKCEHCSTAFNQKVHLNDHILSHHTKVRPYNCHLCNKTYVSKSVLKKHLKKHLGLYKYACEVCSKRFFERSALKKHMRTHTSNFPLNKLKSEEPLQCHACLTYFHFKYKLITHQMLEHGLCRENETCYQCPLCDIKFNISAMDDKEALPPSIKQEKISKQETSDDNDHLPIQVKQEKISDLESSGEPNSEQQTTVNNLVEPDYPTHLNDHKTIFANLKITTANMQMIISEHIKSHEYVENHMCELCYKVFESRENLMRHLKIHDDKESKRFKCEQCDKRFSSNAELNKHSSAIHQRLKLHECDLCGKNFSQRNNLKRHLEEVHRTDGMKFECYVCSKVLATSHSLKRHLLIHNGPKYTCEICAKEFTRVYELNIHKKLHEDESMANQLKCEFCGKVFLKKSNLKAHIENNHLDYSCLECKAVGEEISFDTKKNLLLHLKTKHKNVISNVYLTCLICFKTFLTEVDLGKHTKMHMDDNQIQCRFCNKYFSRNYNLKQHMKTCTKNVSNGILNCDDNEGEYNGHGSHEENEDDEDYDDMNEMMLVPVIKMELKEENEENEDRENQSEEENYTPVPEVSIKRETDPLSVEDIISAGEVSITPIPQSNTNNHGSGSTNNTQANKIIQCHICLKTFAKKDSLKKHMKVFHTYISPDAIKEESGEGKPNILEVILQEGKVPNNNAIIQCRICSKTFTRKDSLRKHMRRFHIINDTNVKKEFTEGQINRNMLDVILKESGHEIKSRIPCELCYKTFTRKDSLRKHMKIFHTRRNPSANSGNSETSAPPAVKLEQNGGEKVENSTSVENSTRVENSANVENTSSVDNRTSVGPVVPIDRIPCTLCDKTFTRKDSLKKHIRIFHTQNQPQHTNVIEVALGARANAAFIDRIRCELCDKSFTRKDSLKKHNRIFHGGADPKVMDEQMARGSADFLEVVLNEDGEGEPVSITNEILCKICNRTFTRNYNLKKHMKTVHKIDDNEPYFAYENTEYDEEEGEMEGEEFGSLSNSMLEVIIRDDEQ